MKKQARETKDSPEKQYKHDELPPSVTREIYVDYGVGRWNAGKISINDYDHTGGDGFERVRLCSQTITIKIPEKQNIKAKCLEVLEDEKSRVMAENHQRLKAVQDKIDHLLAIEYQPGA